MDSQMARTTDIPFEVLLKREKQSLKELQQEIHSLEVNGFDSTRIDSLKEQLEKKKKMLEDFEFQHLESQMDSDNEDEEMEFDVEAAESQMQKNIFRNGHHNLTPIDNLRNISPISERSEDGHDEALIEDGFESDNAISDEILKSNTSLNTPNRPSQSIATHHPIQSNCISFQYSPVGKLPHSSSSSFSTSQNTAVPRSSATSPSHSYLSPKESTKWSPSQSPNHLQSTAVIAENPFKVPYPPPPKEKKITFQEFVQESDSQYSPTKSLEELVVNDMDTDEAIDSDGDDDKDSSTRSSSLSEDSKGCSQDSGQYHSSSSANTRTNPPRSTRPLTRYLPATDPDFNLRQHIASNGHQIDSDSAIQIDTSTCRGYLYKLSGKFRGWQKRWFIFDRKRKLLSYFSSPKSNKPKGYISFSDIMDVFVDHNQRAKTGHSKCTFCIESRASKSMFLSANSLNTMRVWIEVIFTGAEGYLSLNPYASMASLAPDDFSYGGPGMRSNYAT